MGSLLLHDIETLTNKNEILSLILAGQMIVTDTSSGSERAGALGLLGISYGVGMVIGPFIGGLVTKFFR